MKTRYGNIIFQLRSLKTRNFWTEMNNSKTIYYVFHISKVMEFVWGWL